MPTEPLGAFHQGVELLLDQDMTGSICLYADDAVMEFPFAPPGRPDRLEGRAAAHEYLIDHPDRLDIRRIKDSTVHRARDPQVLVASGEPCTAHYIAVLTVRDGHIAHHRDYWNPLAIFPVTDGGGRQ